jgi:predicted PurR-regulated permease PerM
MLAAKLPSTTTLIERLIALGAVACLLVGVALVLRPFVTGILFGSIIVITTWPIRDWLVRQGLSVGLTATVLLLVAVGTVGVPAIILAPGLENGWSTASSVFRRTSWDRRNCRTGLLKSLG